MSGGIPDRRTPCRALTAAHAGTRRLLLAAGLSLAAAATAIAQPVTSRVSEGSGGIQANRPSSMPAISADGRWIAFESSASNLVPGDTNENPDVFLHDRQTGTTTRVSVGPGGAQGNQGSGEPAISGDGRGSFYVRVHARSGASPSAASNEIRIHVNVPVAPSAPANLLGLANGSTLALAWANTYEGGTPTAVVLDVTGAINTSIDLGLIDSFALAGVPAGTYTLALRAANGGGAGARSNAVTLTFPGPCSGPPSVPSGVRVYRVGRTIEVAWAPGTEGPAPTGYVLIVTGSTLGSFATSSRVASGTVGPGAYALSVVAANACGASPSTPPQQVIVP